MESKDTVMGWVNEEAAVKLSAILQ